MTNSPYKTASLPELVLAVVASKGTERPFTGEYDNFGDSGTYLCRQCGLALFRSSTKFHSGCGWPSFDEELPQAVLRVSDIDGSRTEIVCSRCHAHLGHVFIGEGMTEKNTRHCVNSLSLDFVASKDVTDTEEAIFAAGCFWGVEYLFKKLPGVLRVEVGYSGGRTKNPTYKEICAGNTGHYEVIRVLYDPNIVNYANVCKYFFEIHDPTQKNGQGPDLGEQYLSVVFFYNEDQKKTAESIIDILKQQGLLVATSILPVSVFWRAEEYHQDYYSKTGKQPYCHHYIKRF
jgi:peptide methionine sulfoxide reductase msrA/msrB